MSQVINVGYGEQVAKGARAVQIDSLTNSTRSMMSAVVSLQNALKCSNAVEAILLLDAIEAAAKLKQRIEAIAAAASAS